MKNLHFLALTARYSSSSSSSMIIITRGRQSCFSSAGALNVISCLNGETPSRRFPACTKIFRQNEEREKYNSFFSPSPRRAPQRLVCSSGLFLCHPSCFPSQAKQHRDIFPARLMVSAIYLHHQSLANSAKLRLLLF
jgi:hypothetical protein